MILGREIDTIVFIVGNKPFDNRDFERFGIIELEKAGCNSIIIDCSQLFDNSDEFSPFSNDNRLMNFVKPRDWQDFKQQLSIIDARRSVVISMLWMEKKTERFWRILGDTELSTIVMTLGVTPTTTPPVGITSRIWKKIRKLPVAIYKKYYFRHFPKLDYWLISGSECLIRYSDFVKLSKQTKIIHSHNFDYDTYLKSPKEVTQKYIVVLDQNFLNHPDYKRSGNKTGISEEIFRKSISEFLTQAETVYKVPVVIAAHPTSDVNKINRLYNGRRIVAGKTGELVREAKIVFAFFSAAIQFAVIYKKPIVFLTSNELNNNRIFQNMICEFSKSLYKQPVNIDEKVGSAIWKNSLQVDNSVYKIWMSRYIKNEKSSDQTIWQNVFEEVQQKP